jgi:hypothetical protein
MFAPHVLPERRMKLGMMHQQLSTRIATKSSALPTSAW